MISEESVNGGPLQRLESADHGVRQGKMQIFACTLLAARFSVPWQQGPGWRTLLHSHDFGEWEAVVANTLGHHRTRMRKGCLPFAAQIRSAQVDEFQLLWIQGSGQLELRREQCDDGVLWLPFQGMIQETINGVEHLAEPGTGLLFQPGDALTGLTAETVQGVSIVLPQRYLTGIGPHSPLFREGIAAQELIRAGWEMVDAAANRLEGAAFAAERFVSALQQVCNPLIVEQQQERVTAKRRRVLVAEACDWMKERLAERFSVVELSAAMNVSVRTLQSSFQTELGCPPMAELKRMRLHQLRQFLLDPALNKNSVAELMGRAGLLACGVTAADYQRWWGELPRHTRKSA